MRRSTVTSLVIKERRPMPLLPCALFKQCHVASPSTFIPTISYSPAPSLPLPRPLPRPYPCSSSPVSLVEAAVELSPVVLCADPPKFIGLNSRYWQLHTPRLVITAALVICKAHHNRFCGMDFEYRDTTTRCMAWSVRAKSGTNLLLDTRSKIETTLPVRQRHCSHHDL